MDPTWSATQSVAEKPVESALPSTITLSEISGTGSRRSQRITGQKLPEEVEEVKTPAVRGGSIRSW